MLQSAEARDPQGANKNGERLGDGGCHRKYAAEWDAEWKYAMEHFDEIIEDLRTSNHIWFDKFISKNLFLSEDYVAEIEAALWGGGDSESLDSAESDAEWEYTIKHLDETIEELRASNPVWFDKFIGKNLFLSEDYVAEIEAAMI